MSDQRGRKEGVIEMSGEVERLCRGSIARRTKVICGYWIEPKKVQILV